MKKQTLLLFLLIFSLFAFCEQNNSRKQDLSTSTNTDNTPELTEKQAYKMLYDNQVKANDSVLKTIFYALGGLASAMILVFASNWWFNDKKVKDIINEIDTKIEGVKVNMLAELTEKNNALNSENATIINNIQTKLQDEINTYNTALTLKFTSFTEEIRAEIKQDNKELLINYQKQLETFTTNYMQQIATLNSAIGTVTINLRELIDSKSENLKSLINSETQTRLSELNLIKSQIFRTEYWLWDAQGVHNNALGAQLNEIDVLIQNKVTDFSFYLDQLLETVNKLTYVTKYELYQIDRLSKLIPESDSELMQAVVERVKKIKILGQE